MRLLAALLLVVGFESSAHAIEAGFQFRFAQGFGGDTIPRTNCLDAGRCSGSTIDLGNYRSVELGPSLVLYRDGLEAFQVDAPVGIGWQSSEDDLSPTLFLMRALFEPTLGYRRDFPDIGSSLHVAGGLAAHNIGGVFEGGPVGTSQLPNGIGWLAEVRYVFTVLAASVRYTHMTLGLRNGELNASSLALGLSLVVPAAEFKRAKPQ